MSDIYLETLRRIPDDVILSMATRPINLYDACACVCGWASREVVARQTNTDASEADIHGRGPVGILVDAYGNARDGWYRINGAAPNHETGDALELAFVERVLECVR